MEINLKYLALLTIILVFCTRLESLAEVRTWKLIDGRTFEAEIAAGIQSAGTVKLLLANGRKVEIELDQLSAEDRNYIELSRPPKLDIDIIKNLNKVNYSGQLSLFPSDVRDPEIHATFGVRIKQVSSADYTHKLKAELFAVGQQIFARRFKILDRTSWTFRLTAENKKEFEARSKRNVVMRDFYLKDYYDQSGYARRGEKYFGYIIVVTDESGKIVAHRESNQWLYDGWDNLQKLAVGNYMDETCTRQYPIRPDTMQCQSQDFH